MALTYSTYTAPMEEAAKSHNIKTTDEVSAGYSLIMTAKSKTYLTSQKSINFFSVITYSINWLEVNMVPRPVTIKTSLYNISF